MERLRIEGSNGAVLEFFERTPVDPSRPLERFKARLTNPDLSALVRVYPTGEPAGLFAQMAASWTGWQGGIEWGSPEGELVLAGTYGRGGHITLKVVMRPGIAASDWLLGATLELEAGGLEHLARAAAEFFGQPA